MKPIIMELISNVILALIGCVLYGLLRFIQSVTKEAKAKADLIRNEDKRTLLLNAFGRIDTLAEVAVKATESVIAKDLRQMVKSGQKEKQELNQLAADVLEKIKLNIEPAAMNLLEESLSDVDGYIKDVIEVQLEIIKQEYY